MHPSYLRAAAALAVVAAMIPATLSAQDAQATDQATAASACVQTFDENANYFPEPMTVEYAQGFMLEYFSNYKLLTVTRPWQDADVTFTYVLVQCGTPAPDDLPEDAQVIEVPVSGVVSMSTTYLPAISELGLIDQLVSVDEGDFAYNPDVRAAIAAGDVVEVGSGPTVDVETLLDLQPGLILTYGSGFADYDTYPVLQQAGLSVVLNGDYVENTPLGRAEWMKAIAAFFNRETEANELFEQIEADYTELAQLAAGVDERPTVLVNGLYSGQWYISGGDSYVANLISDAGGDYLWTDEATPGGIPLSFEAVLERAQEADVWLNANFWYSLEDGLAEDERYAEFSAFENDQVYNPILRVNEFGGNDYYESSALHPEYALADLIAIFHPELVPDHEFIYYERLQ